MQIESKQASTAETIVKRDKVIALISETANRHKPVDTSALLQDLEQWDSLAALDFVMAVEKEFNIELKPEEVQKALTVEALIGVVTSKL
jgi:acyl carrier protein